MTQQLNLAMRADPAQSFPMPALLRAFLSVLLLGLLSAPGVWGQEQLITDRVFYVRDPKSNAVDFQMIVLAGSADETNPAQQGIAHYLEHVVLVGRNAGHGETAVKFFADGASNGWTNQRATAYTHRFPSNAADVEARLDRLFRFYAERLTDFAISPEDAARERNVVRQEHDLRYASSATAPLWMEVGRWLYAGHAFAESTIGRPETIAAFTADEARSFLKRWYRKSNVWFIVTGPLPAEQVKAAAERHLAALDASPPPPRAWREQHLAPQTETRVFRRVDRRIATPSIVVNRLVTAPPGEELRRQATFSLVNAFLGSKLTGSPHSVLVEGDAPIAAAVNAARIETGPPGTLQMSLGGVPEEGRSLADLKTGLDDYRKAIAARGLDQAVLDRLKKRLARDLARSREEPQNAPQRLVGWLTRPLPYEALKDWPDMIASVTLDEVNAQLAAFAGEAREAVVMFEPEAVR
jgi:zinc protease